MFIEAFETGELTESQKRSVLSSIYKKGDHNLIKKYRPISLATTDYKIIAFIMKPIMLKIIHESQTGYVKGRYIGQNIRMVLICNFLFKVK